MEIGCYGCPWRLPRLTCVAHHRCLALVATKSGCVPSSLQDTFACVRSRLKAASHAVELTSVHVPRKTVPSTVNVQMPNVSLRGRTNTSPLRILPPPPIIPPSQRSLADFHYFPRHSISCYSQRGSEHLHLLYIGTRTPSLRFHAQKRLMERESKRSA